MDKKILVVIALIGIGLYALPATMALFAGQHSFVNIDAVGNQIDCVKCHGDVKAELNVGLTGTQAPHANFECEFCHRVRAGEASGDNAYSSITYTAVSPTDPLLTVRRTLITTERDMEARNVPVNMGANPTTDTVTFAKTAVLMSGAEVQNVLGMKYKVSPCYKSIATASADPAPTEVACDAAELLMTLLPPEARTFQATSLYNTLGTPLDATPATQLGTFDASKVTFAWAGTQSTRAPYGWTWARSIGGMGMDKTTPFYGFNGAGSEVSNAGTAYHAASLVSCLECHGGEAPTGHHDAEYGVGTGCNACHYAGGANKGGLAGIMAGGFGLGVTAGDTGDLEVHKAFVTNNDGILVYEARPDGTEAASNTACVACHTHVEVDIEYTKPTTVVITSDLGMTNTEAAITTEVAGGSTITYS